MNSLTQRILTAIVLIPVVVGGVFLLPTAYLAPLLALIILLGGWEWARLAAIRSPGGKLLFLGLLAAMLWLSSGLLSRPDLTLVLLLVAGGWWLLVTVDLIRRRQVEAAGPGWSPLRAAAGFIVLVPAWLAMMVLHGSGDQGPVLVIFLLVLIWVADSGAYFAGCRWGRIKLAPVISPGKTWEGVYGAVAGALFCGGVLAWTGLVPGGMAVLLLICVLTTLVSVVGDLFESLLKRQAGVKDSGQLLPGHGGVLDRIDSLTAAAPVFLLGLLLTGGIG